MTDIINRAEKALEGVTEGPWIVNGARPLDEVKAQVLVGSVIVVGAEDGDWYIEHGRVPSWAKVDVPLPHWKDPPVWPSSWLTYDLGRETSCWVICFAVWFKRITGHFPSEDELDWLEQKSTSLRSAEEWLLAAGQLAKGEFHPENG